VFVVLGVVHIIIYCLNDSTVFVEWVCHDVGFVFVVMAWHPWSIFGGVSLSILSQGTIIIVLLLGFVSFLMGFHSFLYFVCLKFSLAYFSAHRVTFCSLLALRHF